MSALLSTCSRTKVSAGVFTKKICHTLDTRVSRGSTPRLVPMTTFANTSKPCLKGLENISKLTQFSPEILYNSIATSPDRLAKIKNTTMFHEDLKANKLPQWMFISKHFPYPHTLHHKTST